MKTNELFAVTIGRYQPFHTGHESKFQQIEDNFDNVIILIGEQQDSDPLTFEQRANFFRTYLKTRFKKVVIMPMYDHEDWFDWATEVKNSACEISNNLVLVKAKKEKDIDKHGWHYLDYLDKWFSQSFEVNVDDHNIHATNIRKNPDSFIHLVPKELRPYIVHSTGNKYESAEITDLHNDSLWVQLKQFSRDGRGGFIFSERRNKDSIAFVIRNTDTNCIGLVIEQKPPIGIVDVISAFGGSFDKPNDNPYRIVRQEAVEEAGITEFYPIYKGSYMATTQSSEVVHCFLLDTKQEEMVPQTTDIGELGNKVIWLEYEEAKAIPDWRIQMILND